MMFTDTLLAKMEERFPTRFNADTFFRTVRTALVRIAANKDHTVLTVTI